MHFIDVQSFGQWRDTARRLVLQNTPPNGIHWGTASDQISLFGNEPDSPTQFQEPGAIQADGGANPKSELTVPPAFISLARNVACHRAPVRWELLYRTLWRLCHGERSVLERVTDDDVHVLNQMQKSVSRDVHKMKAFVRFRKVSDDRGVDNYIAWHRPDHRIVRLAAPFFARRFKAMNWSILTPDESAHWDQQQLKFDVGVPASESPDKDALEELWRTYYASIFNPARVKIAMMKREMPVRHWATLPEASLIDDLLRQAPSRVDDMIEKSEGFSETAMHFMPARSDLAALKAAAMGCQACPLYGPATQTVFGHGPTHAKLMIVGEQPGDREDLAGMPFVGPAGQLLNAALKEAGLDRENVYLTNVVKHFKFVETESTGASSRGKHRLHKKPGSREIFACRPWLEAEIATMKPTAIVCLGATAAQALCGRDFRISEQRGTSVATEWCQHTLATWHPSAILRMPNETRREQMKIQLIQDLRGAAAMLVAGQA